MSVQVPLPSTTIAVLHARGLRTCTLLPACGLFVEKTPVHGGVRTRNVPNVFGFPYFSRGVYLSNGYFTMKIATEHVGWVVLSLELFTSSFVTTFVR